MSGCLNEEAIQEFNANLEYFIKKYKNGLEDVLKIHLSLHENVVTYTFNIYEEKLVALHEVNEKCYTTLFKKPHFTIDIYLLVVLRNIEMSLIDHDMDVKAKVLLFETLDTYGEGNCLWEFLLKDVGEESVGYV